MQIKVKAMGENYIGTLIQNVQLHQMVTRDDLIALYYHAGYSVNEIIGFLACHHSSAISERQVHRILRRMNIQRRNNESLLEDIVRAIILELNGSGGNVGYRNMKRRLLTNHGVLATAETVRLALVVLDAEGVLARSRHVLRRRQYISKGPNFSIHIDGWDKLKPYGISIHAGIDGYSRRILWLRACSSNKKPEYIAHFYLKYVREINGVPSIIYGDRGTENAIVRDIQYALRWYHRDPFQGLSSFIYGSSTRNTRIERFWRNLRSMCGQYWMDVFKEMADHGILDTSDNIHFECIRFCFMSFINRDLNDTIQQWNEHRIRRSKNTDGPFGKPDVLYFQPEVFATRDFRLELPGNIDHIEREFSIAPPENGVSDEFQELASALIQEHRLQFPPRTKDDALELFCNIVNAIDSI